MWKEKQGFLIISRQHFYSNVPKLADIWGFLRIIFEMSDMTLSDYVQFAYNSRFPTILLKHVFHR